MGSWLRRLSCNLYMSWPSGDRGPPNWNVFWFRARADGVMVLEYSEGEFGRSAGLDRGREAMRGGRGNELISED